VISFECDLDFSWTYQAETILVVSRKTCITLKLIKLGLKVGRKKKNSNTEKTLNKKCSKR